MQLVKWSKKISNSFFTITIIFKQLNFHIPIGDTPRSIPAQRNSLKSMFLVFKKSCTSGPNWGEGGWGVGGAIWTKYKSTATLSVKPSLSIICWSSWSTRHSTPHHPRRFPVGLAAFNCHPSSTSGWSCICLSPHRSVQDLRLPLIWNICRKMALGRPHWGTHSDIARVWKFSWLLARMSRLLWSHTPVEDAQWTCRSPERRGYFFRNFVFAIWGRLLEKYL